jgi:hypothetical protein
LVKIIMKDGTMKIKAMKTVMATWGVRFVT